MKDSRLSPEEFAKRLGVSGMSVRRWLSQDGDPKLEPLYSAATRDAAFRLLIEGRVSSEDRSVRAILAESEDLAQRASLKAMGVEPDERASDLFGHSDAVISALVDIGSSERRREAVRASSRAISSFRKIGREWAERIGALNRAARSTKLTTNEKLAAYGALFYLVAPFDLIPDALPVFGLIDDFALLGVAASYYSDYAARFARAPGRPKEKPARKTGTGGPKRATVAFLAAIAFGAWRPASAITLDRAIEASLERSPQVQSQKRLTRLAQGDKWRRFVISEPVAQFVNADDASTEAYGLQLTVPFPGKVFASYEVDVAKAEAAERELASRMQDVARSTAQAYLDCATARGLSEIQKSSLAYLEALERTIEVLYESGRSTQAEKIGAELQLRQARLDAKAAQDKSEVACKRLAAVLGEETSPTTEDLPDDLSSDRVRALGPRTADQLRAQSAIRLASASRDAAYWSQAPDVTLGAARYHYPFLPASPSTREWATTFTASLTFPILFLFQENVEAQRARAQSDLDRAVASLQLRQAELDRLEAAKEFVRSQARLKELREKDLVLAQALVESSLAAYRLGRLGFAEVLFARRTLSDLRAQDLQLKSASVLARLRCLDECRADSTSDAQTKGKQGT